MRALDFVKLPVPSEEAVPVFILGGPAPSRRYFVRNPLPPRHPECPLCRAGVPPKTAGSTASSSK